MFMRLGPAKAFLSSPVPQKYQKASNRVYSPSPIVRARVEIRNNISQENLEQSQGHRDSVLF